MTRIIVTSDYRLVVEENETNRRVYEKYFKSHPSISFLLEGIKIRGDSGEQQ